MKTVKYIFWIAIATCFAVNSSWSFSQIGFIASVGILLFISVANQQESSEESNGNELEDNESILTPFNDAIVKELMRIRLDLINLRIKQEKQYWPSFPNDFLSVFFMYRNYPSSAICETYRTPSDKQGGIVILLDNIDLMVASESNAETLRKINSIKVNKVARGMEFPVYVYEPEFGERFHEKQAEVLSITKKTDDMGYATYILTLKIDLSWEYQGYKHKKIITRAIDLLGYTENCDFEVDNVINYWEEYHKANP